ncbi:peptidoglycan-binding domain-containing protein [Vannielia sp. SX4]|uniref:peptidoglycan-binding domain-containing protein n=1 Tax=Vannielia sp. SX4 TaxID=3463852 RepID=UPI0040590153
MTNPYRRICAVLALVIGAGLAASAPLLAQEAVGEAGAEAAVLIDDAAEVDVSEGVNTDGIIGEDVQVTRADDGTPIVRVAIPATVFMPIEDEEHEDMLFTLQEELNRLGCDAGPVDGDWGRRSEQAMDRLRDAVPDISEMELSITLAGLMQMMPEGTCPLVCSVREVKVDNRCELKTCPSGQYLDTRGSCQVRQAKASKPKRSSSGGGGSARKCATYNGRTYCN